MAINTGVNASKVVGFIVLDKPVAVDVSKLVAYAVIQDGQPQQVMMFLLP